MKLDIACGQNKQEGFTGVDISTECDADVIHDLTKFPWPFEDDSVEEAFCSHYVEHTPDLMAFMDECWRVMEDGAQIRIVHPYAKSDRAFQDPTHTRFIPEATWYYFSKEWREQQKLDHYPIVCNFQIVNIVASFNPPWDRRSAEAQQFGITHYWNVVSDLAVDLKAIKS